MIPYSDKAGGDDAPRALSTRPELPLDTPVLDAESSGIRVQLPIISPQSVSPPFVRSLGQSPQSHSGRFRVGESPDIMSYQNYVDSPQMGSGPSPRQAPSPSQGMNHTNGINGGGGGMPGMMAGLPTPAGHQADLNIIYNLVEDLHNQLAENQARTERIVAAAGQVRQRALDENLTTDEIIASVSQELDASTQNLEEENSRLHKALEHATYEESAYKDLCHQYAHAIGHFLELAHASKLKTTLDMCAWHRSYRTQLAAERAENLELRARITDMQASAARGMEHMRQFRRAWDGSDLVMELRAEIVSLRQQSRGWKRVALSELASDDSEFSDDDDVVDPEEKKRLVRVQEEKRIKEDLAAKQAAEGGADEVADALAATLAASNLAGAGAASGPGAPA